MKIGCFGRYLLVSSIAMVLAAQSGPVRGIVLDPQGKPVANAVVHLRRGQTEMVLAKTDAQGAYRFDGVGAGDYLVAAEAPGFTAVSRAVHIPVEGAVDIRFSTLAMQAQSVEVISKTLEPSIDLRNAEVFNKTLFTRDDQVLQQLNAGINAGQHEGGGKSLEIRRFGFNLDHGGVNGGLKVMLDDVQQNQGTQGHGQGYLGALKAVTPELIEQVTLINGPFSAEYGDFSGLGVVHIRQREKLDDQYTVRLQGGNFNTRRAFVAVSPNAQGTDAYVAYDGSYSDGPFISAGKYRRDNVNANYSRGLGKGRKAGGRFVFGRNNFDSSGQIPLDLVDSGKLDRFGYVDPTDGGRVRLGTLSGYFQSTPTDSSTLRVDGFVSRSLFDLFSNFTFYLNGPVNGDAIQQHDSRLQEGGNVHYSLTQKIGTFTAGANFHDNQINVSLYPREGRVPTGVTTRGHAHVTNQAGYGQENVILMGGKLMLGGGLRYDSFRYDLDGVHQWAGRWQGKGSMAFTPSLKKPLTIHLNYGRGINSVDARGVIEHPELPRIATTDFYQLGTSSNFGRVSVSTDLFLIDHSNEQVYIPDDGTFEFKGPSRAYGYEAKASVELTHHLSLNGGMTKVGNSFFRGGNHRVYVDSAPHFVGNGSLTLAGWRGWSGSLRMRAINHYILDGDDPAILASGHTVFDMSAAKQLSRRVEFSVSLDNLTSRDYYETQNYFESRVTPTAPVVARIHATPAYPLTAVGGLTLRFGHK